MSQVEKPEVLAEAISNFNLDCCEMTGFENESISCTTISFFDIFATFEENFTTLDREILTTPAASKGHTREK